MIFNKFLKKSRRIQFSVDDKPPKKSTADSCWTSKEVNHVFELRKKALEARKKAGLNDCFTCPVRITLTVYAPNILHRKDRSDYVGDLDSIVGGVCESLRSADEQVGHVPIFAGYDEIAPKVPLILEDDDQVKEIIADKKVENKTHYIVVIEPLE